MILKKLRKSSILSTVAIALLAFAAGCAHVPQKNEKEEAALRRIAVAQGLTVIVDSSVIHGKTTGNDIVATEENMSIAKAVEERTVAALRAKGYTVHTPGINSIGINLPSGKTYDLLKTADEKAQASTTGTADSAPFMLTPDTASARSLAKSVAAKAPLTASDTKDINGELLVVVKAKGRYISGGQMAANVPLGAVNVLLIGLMMFGGSSGGGDIPVFIMMDEISLELSVIEKATGEVLITKAFASDDGTDPDSNNLGTYVDLVIKGLPTAIMPVSSK
ncbi:MAG: hypothetical protein OEV59_02725 [Deltaproteobacteria bacterium]|nr:hypothetical protein [Deltaproteobacteria bacterium]